jgi:hypothetical protein
MNEISKDNLVARSFLFLRYQRISGVPDSDAWLLIRSFLPPSLNKGKWWIAPGVRFKPRQGRLPSPQVFSRPWGLLYK